MLLKKLNIFKKMPFNQSLLKLIIKAFFNMDVYVNKIV